MAALNYKTYANYGDGSSGAPSRTRLTQGGSGISASIFHWTVGKTAAGKSADAVMDSYAAASVLAATFATDSSSIPGSYTGLLSSNSHYGYNGIELAAPGAGMFASGNWSFGMAVTAVTVKSQAGRLKMRFWKGSGGSYTEIGSGFLSSIFTPGTYAKITVTAASVPEFSVDSGNDIVVTFAWEITTPGTSTSADVRIDLDSSGSLGTLALTPNFTAGSPQPSGSQSDNSKANDAQGIAFKAERGQTDNAKANDDLAFTWEEATLAYSRTQTDNARSNDDLAATRYIQGHDQTDNARADDSEAVAKRASVDQTDNARANDEEALAKRASVDQTDNARSNDDLAVIRYIQGHDQADNAKASDEANYTWAEATEGYSHYQTDNARADDAAAVQAKVTTTQTDNARANDEEAVQKATSLLQTDNARANDDLDVTVKAKFAQTDNARAADDLGVAKLVQLDQTDTARANDAAAVSARVDLAQTDTAKANDEASYTWAEPGALVGSHEDNARATDSTSVQARTSLPQTDNARAGDDEAVQARTSLPQTDNARAGDSAASSARFVGFITDYAQPFDSVDHKYAGAVALSNEIAVVGDSVEAALASPILAQVTDSARAGDALFALRATLEATGVQTDRVRASDNVNCALAIPGLPYPLNLYIWNGASWVYWNGGGWA